MNKDNDKRTFKDAVYKQIARLGKALSSGPRLEILDLLTQGPRTVEAVAGEVGQSIANTSHHLRALAKARLVESKREGLYVTYRVAGGDVAAVYTAVRTLAESRLREIGDITRDFLDERDALEAVDAEELVQRLEVGDVTLIDVRPRSEYEAGHLPGAVSLPLDELDVRMYELPAGVDVVAYCRGPYCVMALEAVHKLRDGGFRAAHMGESVPGWQARGYEAAR